MSKLNPEEAAEAHAKYMRGATYEELEEEYECSNAALLYAFRPLGLRGKGGRGHSTELDGTTVGDGAPYALLIKWWLQ